MLLATSLFFGCGPNDQSILKKYETHSPLEQADNRAEIRLRFAIDTIQIGDTRLIIDNKAFQVLYSHPALTFNKKNVELLSSRLFLANAENPSEQLEVKFSTIEQSPSGNDSTKTAYLFQMNNEEKEIVDRKLKYLLVGFKGIDKSEFAGAATPPCFFIVSLDKKNPHLLTEVPLSAGDLFAADSVKGKFIRFAEPQVYSGTVAFKKSKDTKLTFTVSADAEKVTELDIEMKELSLSPKKEYNMGFKISGITINGGFTIPNFIDVLDDKIVSNNVIVCDLTLTDACIYGTVKIDLDEGVTDQVSAVFKNITTPQDIPDDILTLHKH
jgi:hypothetical protein